MPATTPFIPSSSNPTTVGQAKRSMTGDVQEDRLIVTSDVHLGNWFFTRNRSFLRFLDFVLDSEYSLCINGDGLDILQTSLVRMTSELSEMFSYLGRKRPKTRLYYTVGNHDIVLEHFIDDYRFMRLAPFLNVRSGDARIRVEHGHLYDPAFVRNPDLYFAMTRLGGHLLRVHPMFYNAHTFGKSAGAWWRRLTRRDADGLVGIHGEHPTFVRAARELADRGFDTIVFGHTHIRGTVALGEGRTYFNTGSWLGDPHYLKIVDGEAELLAWTD